MKTKKYKIINKLPEPNADFLEGLQDFDAVKNMAQTVNPSAYKIPKQFSVTKWALLVGSIMLVLVYVYFWSNQKSQIDTQEAKVEKYRNVPLKDFETQFEYFEIYSGKADTLYTKSGSIIVLPPCRLLDGQQKEVSGKVELKFRQYNNAAELALSGITLNYDSAANSSLFESNGMFEIYATQQAQSLKINPNCPCKVLLATNSLDTRFNNYYLDTSKQQWQYLGPIVIEEFISFKTDESVSSTAPPAPATQEVFVEEVLPSLPIKKLPPAPQEDNPKLPDFKIVANEADFPELALYKGVLFEVEPMEAERSVPLFAKTWSNIDLVTIKSGRLYKVRMQKMNRSGSVLASDSIIVHPIVPDENYEEALETFKSLEKAYSIEVREQRRRIAMQKRRDIYLQDSLGRAIERRDKLRTRTTPSNTIPANLDYGGLRASFSVASFGIYNSDCPIQLPSNTLVANVKSKNNVYYSHIYQVIPAINSFMANYSTAYNSKVGAEFVINPFYSEKEKWFIVLDNKSIAVWESTYIKKNQFDLKIYLNVDEAKIYTGLSSSKDAVAALLK